MSGSDVRYRISRRRFLGMGAAGTAMVATGSLGVACGGGGGSDDGVEAGTATLPPLTGDVAVADLAARLENLAIDAYDDLIVAASGGKMGVVPALVGAVVTLARAQHVEHLAEWNKVIRAAGKPEVNTADIGLKPSIDSVLVQVEDVEGIARLALLVEEILADTYLKSIPVLIDKESVSIAARILVTDQQHQVLLRYALGENPVPEPLQIPDRAAS